MLPYLQSVTAQYSITFGIAASTFLGVIVISIQNHKQYILSTLFPAGSPVWLSPLLVPIELILYIFRPFSLSIRLFANMMAGHCLLVIVISYFTIFIHIGSKLRTVPISDFSQDTVFSPNFFIDDPLCIEKMTMKVLREIKIGVPREYAKKVEKSDVAGKNSMGVINQTDQSKLTILT
jgi:hypothetical protein